MLSDLSSAWFCLLLCLAKSLCAFRCSVKILLAIYPKKTWQENKKKCVRKLIFAAINEDKKNSLYRTKGIYMSGEVKNVVWWLLSLKKKKGEMQWSSPETGSLFIYRATLIYSRWKDENNLLCRWYSFYVYCAGIVTTIAQDKEWIVTNSHVSGQHILL